MTRSELVDLIDAGNDIMFDCDGKSFTILGWYEDGPIISEQVTEDNERVFKDGAQLVDNYIINGKPLKDRLHQIDVTFHS